MAGVALVLEARSVAYDLLRRIWIEEPSPHFVRLLVGSDVPRTFPFGDHRPALREALSIVGSELARPDAASDTACARLQEDYTRLFVAPPPLPAPPWESLYRDRERLHFSEHTLEVRTAYQRHGLAAGLLGREPDDHLGFELDFMHRLATLAAELASPDREADQRTVLEDQRAFLDEHLLTWVPAWAEDVMAAAATNFYRGAASLTAAYLLLDRDIVGELLNAPEAARG